MARTLAQKRANRHVAALLSTRNIVSGLKGLLLNETMRPGERIEIKVALDALEENLKNWRIET